MSDEYPLPTTTEEFDPAYQDKAAAELYKVSGGSKLVGALNKLHQALTSQAAKLEEFHNTPYSEDNARLIATTMDTIVKVELQVERWHYLIYPNQRPRQKDEL
jgi:hypothetical protein